MIRNLKVLLAAAMALAAVGAFSASAAQAHTAGTFHCAVQPCAFTIESDGAVPSATAHQVFVIKNSTGESVSITARQLTGYGTSNVKTSDTVTFTNLAYDVVTANGQPAVVRMNGCNYDIKTVASVAPHDFGTVTIHSCTVGKKIEIEIPGTGCIATVKEQGPLGGLTFHTEGKINPKAGETTTAITASAKVPGIEVELDNAAGGKCLIDETKTPITSEYTTGNVTIQGYEDPSGGDTHNSVKVHTWFSPTVT